MVELTINKIKYQVKVELDTPLLWFLRDTLDLTGTKYGCGIQQCGACTVLVKGRTVRSCGVTIEEVLDEEITTIEGLSNNNSHPVQQAWIAEEVPQCGYCQSGQVLAATALLSETPNPTDEDVEAAMSNLCRCGTYNKIRDAVRSASEA